MDKAALDDEYAPLKGIGSLPASDDITIILIFLLLL